MLSMTESVEVEKNSKVLFSFATKNFFEIKNTHAITCSARAVREERAKIIADLRVVVAVSSIVEKAL